MRLVRPAWLAHNDENRRFEIYSLDVSPDEKRLVTGGLDSKVKVWSTKGIADPDEESKPRLLASMSSHTGAVTAVKFSPDGRYIASGSDDRIVLVSELDTSRAPRGEFGSGVAEAEVWTPRKRLVGHDNDVQDLAWSPDGQLLVSVGLDSAIIVWSGQTFEKLKRLNWHQSHVKGVAFDPANKFFVTCSDDRTARVVRYSRASPTELSFSVEAVVTSPFVDSPLTTYFRRCTWSPDGETIVCPNATNGPIPTAAIIDRGRWSAQHKEQLSLVGHEGTTEVARFSPRMYTRANDDAPACIVATAGEDGAVAVWSTTNPRPLIVVQSVAMKMITDLAWSRSGLKLFVSSLDGTVVEIQFAPTELGAVLSPEESQKRLAKYGNVTELMDIPQSVEQIQAAKSAETRASLSLAGSKHTEAVAEESGAIVEGAAVGVSTDLVAPDPAGTASGDALAGQPGGGIDDPAPSATADGQPNEDASVGAASESAEGAPAEVANASKPSTPSASAAGEVLPDSKDSKGAKPMSSSVSGPAAGAQSARHVSPAASAAPRHLPVKQKVSVTKEGRKRVTPMLLNGSAAPATPMLETRPAQRLGSGAGASIAYDRPSAALPPGGIATLVVGNKRKSDDDAVSTATKKARDDAVYLRPVVLNPSTTVSQVRLATPRLVSHISSDAVGGTVIEARNAAHAGDPTRISVVSNGHAVFTDFIAEYASLLAGAAAYFWAVASDTGVLYTYTPQGSRALPPLALGAPVSLLGSNKAYLYAVTATGLAFAWNVLERRALFPPQSVAPCLDTGAKNVENGLVRAPQITSCTITEKGELVLCVSTGSVFHFNAQLHAWERISESFWAYGSQFWDSTGFAPAHGVAGPVRLAELQTNQEALLKNGVRGRQLQRQAINRMVQAGFQGFEDAVSQAHLGTRVAAAISLRSPELQDFVNLYVRRLSERGERLKLGELFRSLRDDQRALDEALDIAAEYTGVQTLVAEYRA